jgi:hypothetical protein
MMFLLPSIFMMECSCASTHPLEGPVGDLANLLNVNIRAGVITLFPKEECGKEHNITLVMAQIDLCSVAFTSRTVATRETCFLCIVAQIHAVQELLSFRLFMMTSTRRPGKCLFHQGKSHLEAATERLYLPSLASLDALGSKQPPRLQNAHQPFFHRCRLKR